VIALDQPLAIGILLLGTGAGAPFLPKLVEFARGNLGVAVGLMVMLMTATVLYMPVALPILLPVARVSPWPLAKPLVIVMLMALIFGLSVRARRPAFARRLHPYLRRASTIALIFAVLLVLAANYSKVVRTINFNTILAGGLLLLVSFGCGYVLGGSSAEHQEKFGIRHSAARHLGRSPGCRQNFSHSRGCGYADCRGTSRALHTNPNRNCL